MPESDQNIIVKIFNAIDGYKTYIIAAGAVLTALGAYLNHSISLTQLVESLYAAFGTMTLRHAISKNQ